MKLEALPPGQKNRMGPFHGSADALAIAELAGKVRPLLVISATAADAQRLLEEIPFFNPALKVHLLPDWETLPYDTFSPHHDLVSERLATLYQITQQAFDVAIVPVTTALYRLTPTEYLAARTFFFKQGERLAGHELRKQLTTAGYTHVTQVLSPGEYSFRGGLIDLFPMGSAVPYRIDLFDDQIDSIRSFDVDTQRSIYKVNEVRLLPAREFPIDEDGQTAFRRNFRARFEGDPSRSRLYKDVSNGIAPAGIEYYLPLFFDHTATLTDYLPPETTIVIHHDVQPAIEHFWQDTQTRYDLLGGDRSQPLLPPRDLFLAADAFFGAIKPYARVEIRALEDTGSSLIPHPSSLTSAPLPLLAVDRRADNPVTALQKFLAEFPGRALLLAESMGRRETMLEYLREHGVKPVPCASYAEFLSSEAPVMLGVSTLAAGYALPEHKIAVITENELYASQVRTRREREARKTTSEGMLRDLSEVKPGDPVVHEQHGIGRYLGLQNLDFGDGATEFLTLEYTRGDKLYVPVSQLHLISRYSGAPAETAPLHDLGSGQWDKAKKKAAKQVRDTAAELLNLYAQRALRQGHAFGLNQHDYDAFSDAFPFEETPDQLAAITATLNDLRQGKPMDRLICGDVGFGKTEVALRAAFVAVNEGKQVGILVPTTLLAEQHFNTFSDRFAGWPVKVAELSRFRSQKQVNATLAGLGEGKVDIVIGTHKLLQSDIKFKNLGLVIIDEEHRFGVRQKERLKALRAEVDVLTLTATPIPRTLGMALEGLRDFSVIATAPQRRLAIKTFVARYSKGLMREAILRELKRGGQIYFLHNDIDTIVQIEENLTRLVPEARIRIAHGQMRERELEMAMRDFYQQHFNILLCTTIIETGIDVPTANTIIINRADRFGLAQLHQLRGRVGRSHHQAYAYLLLPDEGEITTQAKKRLEAIQSMEELGSGFFLAMHDLEIRGAGEVLGDSQSGEMQEVGFNLYCSMLDAAVKSLKLGHEPDLSAPLGVTTEINLHAPALLPDGYCNDIHERLVLYKRLANCDNADELEKMHEELIDRFGLPPPHAKTLLDCHRLRLLGKPLGIARIDASENGVQLQFIPNPPIDAAKVMKLIHKNKHYKLAGPDKIKVSADLYEVSERVMKVKQIFGELTG
jgi:transcription-repair coupling factor (superfamily II helicase)